MGDEIIDRLLGSSAVNKRDATLDPVILKCLTSEFKELNTTESKALFLSMLHCHKSFTDYGKNIVREMRVADRQVFTRHIELPMNKLRNTFNDSTSGEITRRLKELILDVLLYNSDTNDFKILTNLAGRVRGNSFRSSIIEDKSIHLTDEQIDKIFGYGKEAK